MRIVKQVSLFFQEGNSDKVYEIDLCEIGNEQYVVNFRYGRRGAILKEGSKTELAVSREKAESIFNALENEKRAKGYSASGEPAVTSSPIIPVAPINIPEINWTEWPEGREKAILRRLHSVTEGKENTAKLYWKTSRIIWMAGVMKLEVAAPFIINLANKGDLMQQYTAAWSLGRMNNTDAIPLLQSYFKSVSGSNLKRVSGEALLHLLKDEERTKHLQYFLNSLPEPVKSSVENNQPEELLSLLQERVCTQQQPHYSLLEDLYAVAVDYKWVRQILQSILLQLQLRPNHFKHIRHIYKMAEMRDDFEMLGTLSCKFEREEEMFRQSSNNGYDEGNTYILALSEYVNTKKELAKKTSRLAYSNRTRQYLRGRTLRNLNNYGKYDDLNYVRMATGLLLSYDAARDYAAPFKTNYYDYRNGRYQQLQKEFPANAHAVYLNQILSGNAKNFQLQRNNLWAIVDEQAKQKTAPQNRTAQNTGEQKNSGIIQKIFSLFSSKKREAPPIHYAEVPVTPIAEPVAAQHNDTPYIHLWNKLPQAYVQLLINGKMNEIHQFAATNLQNHADYKTLKTKIDNQAIELLLTSAFDIPANFGYNLAIEKYDAAKPDTGLVKALFYCRLPIARDKAMSWVKESPDTFFDDSEWFSSLLFCPHEFVRTWITQQMQIHSYTITQAQLICGRVIATTLATRKNTEINNASITHAGETIAKLFTAQLSEISLTITEDLLKSEVAAAQVLGLKILLLKKRHLNYDELSNEIFNSLFSNESKDVREKGIELLQELSTAELLKRQELVINCCVSQHHDVRANICPIVKRMSSENVSFGTEAVNWLMPYLLRKELHDGLHKDVSDILITELIGFINNADKEMVLRLIYAQYVPTQQFGIAILEKYIDPATFTIRQIIALGNHETLSVREWCWKYFSNNVARIKFEREEAIRLLDSNWDDTRSFAKGFFKENFTDADWSPETLVGLADSVRLDIEAYGRELITRFFTDKDGEQYLLKFSQHPSEKMQLFATNYLDRFAGGKAEKIEALDFYFRSVLSRVNKARVAKNRVFLFLLKEGKQSEAAAKIIAKIISNVSATASVGDKAKCIEIMYELNNLYKLDLPIVFQEVEERVG